MTAVFGRLDARRYRDNEVLELRDLLAAHQWFPLTWMRSVVVVVTFAAVLSPPPQKL
jgi:hypothetical protein